MRVDMEAGRNFGDHGDLKSAAARHGLQRNVSLRLKNASVLDADLVVDASGRGSHTPDWLESLGYQRPKTDRVEIGLAYTTRLFRRTAGQLDGDIAAIIPPTPEGKRGVGTMLARNKAYEAVSKGESYCGPIDVLGTAFDACYNPIKSAGKIIGVSYVGHKK